MKYKINFPSVISIIFDSSPVIVLIIQFFQPDKSMFKVFWFVFGISLISQGITEHRFGKSIDKSSKSYKYSRLGTIVLGIIMSILSIFNLLLR